MEVTEVKVDDGKLVAERPILQDSQIADVGYVSEPGIINDDPQGDGWLIKIKLSTDEEIGKLMSAEAYAKYVSEEEQSK